MRWKEVEDKAIEPTIEFSHPEALAINFTLASDMLMGLENATVGVVLIPKSPKTEMVIDMLKQYKDSLWNQMSAYAGDEWRNEKNESNK